MSLPELLLSVVISPAWAADDSGGTGLIGGLAALVLVAASLTATKRALGLVLASVSGLGLATYLFVQHHAAKTGGASACNINSTLNCDAVNTSAWSEIGGVSIALLGAGYFAAVAFLAVQWLRGVAPRAPSAIVLLAGVGVGYDVFLAWASQQVGALCVLCATTWALNAILLVGALLEARKDDVPFGQGVSETLSAHGTPTAVVGLAVLVIGGLAKPDASGGSATGGASPPSDLAATYEQVNGRIELDGTEMASGPADARFTLVEWADFECPHCALMSEELATLVKSNPDVRVLYKHYPISSICNRNVGDPRHVNACSAAAAAECAGKQSAFTDLAHKMFKNQQYLAPDDIRFLAREVKLDMTAFEACWADPAVMDGIRADVEHATLVNLQGTPAVFLKGPFGEQWVRVKGGAAEIGAVLAAAREGKPLAAPGPSTEG